MSFVPRSVQVEPLDHHRFELGECARWDGTTLTVVDVLAGNLWASTETGPLEQRLHLDVPLGAANPVVGGGAVLAAGTGVAVLEPDGSLDWIAQPVAALRLTDITEANAAIASHLERGDLCDGLVFDAVRIRLLEVGEAVKALPPTDVTATNPGIPWRQIARMRGHLAHRYFDTSHAMVAATVQHDQPQLADAAARLRVNPR